MMSLLVVPALLASDLSQVLAPAAIPVVIVIGFFVTFYFKADGVIDNIAKRAEDRRARKDAERAAGAVPQPLEVKATGPVEVKPAADLVTMRDFNEHLARNREAHARFSTEMAQMRSQVADQRTDMAVVKERTETINATLGNIQQLMQRREDSEQALLLQAMVETLKERKEGK